MSNLIAYKENQNIVTFYILLALSFVPPIQVYSLYDYNRTLDLFLNFSFFMFVLNCKLGIYRIVHVSYYNLHNC